MLGFQLYFVCSARSLVGSRVVIPNYSIFNYSITRIQILKDPGYPGTRNEEKNSKQGKINKKTAFEPYAALAYSLVKHKNDLIFFKSCMIFLYFGSLHMFIYKDIKRQVVYRIIL